MHTSLLSMQADAQQCLRVKEMQEASFVALCQVFAADQSKYDDFISIVNDLIKNLEISEQFAIKCIKRYFQDPIYTIYSDQEDFQVKQENNNKTGTLNIDINFFIPQQKEKYEYLNDMKTYWCLPDTPETDTGNKIKKLWKMLYDTLPSLERQQVEAQQLNKVTETVIKEILSLI